MTVQRLEFTIQKGEQRLVRTFDGGQPIVIGRKSNQAVSLALPSDWSVVSRRHCRIELANGVVTILDMDSVNGTFVDEERLKAGVQKVVGEQTLIMLGDGPQSVKLWVKLISRDDEPDLSPPQSDENTLIARLGHGKELIIGRSQECGIVLEDSKVSRRHARFFQQDGKYFIEDLGSTNGTYVNNQRIDGTREIRTSDTLFIGLHALRLEDVVRNLSAEPVITAEGIAKVFANGNRGLHSTTLTVERAEMVAIMGPSGSGKSTLLKLLNGEIALTTGLLKIYGLDFLRYQTYLGAQMGYVPQDDIIHRDLTVEQTLRFASRIRLPSGLSSTDIDEKIKTVLQMVSMDDPKLMNTLIHELSGGQRKRVSIAVELLNDPKLLFLDEPTSPLDPETIDEFLKCLRNLTANGTTVLMVTHKPEDLAYMDRVVFIGTGGYHAYTGRPDQMPTYFQVESIIGVYALLSDPMKSKSWHERITSERSGPSVKHIPISDTVKKDHLSQWFWQTARYLSVKLGNPTNIWIILLQPLIIALLVAITFDSFRNDVPMSEYLMAIGVADTGLVFLISLAAVWFGVSLSTKEIVSERAIYRRERKMRLTPVVYLLSKQVVLSAMLLIQVTIFVVTLLLRYGREFHAPIATVGFLFVLGSAAILFGLALSAFANSAESAVSILPIALMPQIILSGIVSPVKSTLMELLSYLTFGRWGTEGLARIQDTSDDASGLVLIDQQLYGGDALTWSQGIEQNLIAIGALAVVFFVLVIYKLYALDKTV
jgi:ABC-type multidrug transport system ATPase subunit/pSer/pThr/pTyr-binding forkhead associated (FHA) protein